MEGTLLGLIIVIILAVVFLVLWVGVLAEAVKGKLSGGSSPAKKETPSYSFKRIDRVQGELSFEHRKLRTYQSGTLVLNEMVDVDFYDDNRTVVITDIALKGKSLFSIGTGSYREKADYAIQVLKEMTYQGGISRDLCVELEHLVLEVDTLNELLKAGTISIQGGDFVCA
ncbi:hypothetical protein [Cytobacillus oceanisediminis]|uniref:hypothetical protein n=1 Tax=Cytobacillus oceanisediminis TaxID=665099 RepID=UPI001FB4D9EE|nr:hypothetical protein [Cytobacillus oceanisediminis]UOE58108.1 hypothetical protein IRB79_26735 [Cytobacillus oceanisediminis]